MKRKREHYLVDGYNVIHANPELAAMLNDLSAARDRLVEILEEYGAYEKYEMTIVFDALFTADEEHEEKRGKHLTVVYTGAGETADSFIERRSYELAHNDREVHVVTSDGAEQFVILGAGAYRLPSKELWRRVRQFKERLRREVLKPSAPTLARYDVASKLDSDVAARLDAMRKSIK